MQLERMLSIILILMNKKIVTGEELARHFEVSLRTIYRDIEKISQTIVPISALSGKGGGFYIMDNYVLDKTILSKEEIRPLLSIINSAKAILGSNENFNSFIDKFKEFYKENNIEEIPTIDMMPLWNSIDISIYFDVINKGIEENRLLIFEYVNRNLKQEERKVEPVKIIFEKGNWYFIGYCLNRQDYRTFKFSRIKDLKLGDKFIKRKAAIKDIEDYLRKSFEENATAVTLKFSNRFVPQLEEHFKKEKITYMEDGTAEVMDFLPKDEGLKKFVLSFGTECEVLSPSDLRMDMKKYIEKILSLYNS